ncbi:MAG TPA: DNA adenine methylase, partial [Pirellulaceae bacterium]|nr:DNA adenine methylase [Pirellulaceae bacterium]
IHSRLPERFENYFEPFVGGGALFYSLTDRLNAERRSAELSDHNFELVVTYQVVKKQPEKLIAALGTV